MEFSDFYDEVAFFSLENHFQFKLFGLDVLGISQGVLGKHTLFKSANVLFFLRSE